jgi:hypothetical protein
MTQRAWLLQYIGAGLLTFILLYLPLFSILSAISVFPYLISIFLAISYLTPYRSEQFAAFCLFMRTSPINFALLGRNGNKERQQRQKNIDREHLSSSRPPSFLIQDYYYGPEFLFFNILTFVIFVGYFCLSGSPSYACLDPETPKKYFCLFVDFIVPCQTVGGHVFLRTLHIFFLHFETGYAPLLIFL